LHNKCGECVDVAITIKSIARDKTVGVYNVTFTDGVKDFTLPHSTVHPIKKETITKIIQDSINDDKEIVIDFKDTLTYINATLTVAG